jgi:hypothetical protein
MKLDERNKMIACMVESMDTWDQDALLAWSQDKMTEILSSMTPEDLQREHDEWFNGDDAHE